ncbi:unnamed protein product [Urochloa humidicola]
MASGARAKRARTRLAAPPSTLSGPSPLQLDWRDWANGLSAGPAGLIAELLLSDDVRFRAACAAWRAGTADPHGHTASPTAGSTHGGGPCSRAAPPTTKAGGASS